MHLCGWLGGGLKEGENIPPPMVEYRMSPHLLRFMAIGGG